MAKYTDPSESTDWVREKLAALRAMLEQGGQWPAPADRLLDDLLAAGEEAEPLADEDMEMLALVIGDALQGVDVLTRYAGFYKKLLANGALREAFLDGLTVLEEREMFGPPGSGPVAADVDGLGFLRTARVRPVVEEDAGGRWWAQWLQVKETLDGLLSRGQPTAGVAWRSSEAALDEGYTTLLRSEAAVGERMLYLALVGRQPLETPDVLEVALMVSAEGEGEVGRLVARLEWGEYKDTAVLDEMGQATFVPVPLAMVWQEGDGRVRANLRLTLERET